MKIAMMTNNYKPFVAGVPVSVERLTDSLREAGHEVVVFAPDYDGAENEVGVVRYKSILKGISGGFSVPNSLDPEIENRFKNGKFDLIHVHHPMLIGKTAKYLSRKYQVPLVFTYHTRYEQYLHYVGLSGLKKMIPAYIKRYIKCCNMVFAPTPLMKKYLESLQKDSNKKTQITVIPTGLTEDSFHPDRKKVEEIRKEFAVGNGRLFCTVARLAKEKNLKFLLRSMRILKDTCNEEFRLLLIGDGPERKNLERTARQIGVEENVKFLGAVPNAEVKSYCAASDLFLFTSLSETQGIVLLEAMAVGTPVVALHAAGTEDIVVNGKNGYMTEKSDVNFACMVEDILEGGEIDLLKKGAKETARMYQCEKIAQEVVKSYKIVCK